jgi:hypothetical protein
MFILYQPLRSPLFPSQFERRTLPTFPLVVSYSCHVRVFNSITLTLSSIDLALILIFNPTLKKTPLFHLNLRVTIYLSGPWTYPFPLASLVLTPSFGVLIFLIFMPIYLFSYILVRYHL